MKQQSLPFILLLCLLSPAAFAQKNRVEVYMGGYRIPNVLYYSKGITSLWGIGVSRNINNKVSIGIKYAIPNVPLNSAQTMTTDRLLTTEESVNNYNDTGKLIERNDYHYFDAGISYKLFAKKRHSVSASQFLTLALGKNLYLTSFSDPYPGSDFLFTTYETKKEAYLGGVSSIKYDYAIWKNRINIGLDIAARYYTGGFPFQINYGLHLGYNF